MGARGFDRSGGDAPRRPAQRVDHEGGVETADAMAFEQFGYRRLAQTARLVRRRRGFPEFEQPFGAEVVLEFEQGRELAPELLAQAVDEAVPPTPRSSAMRDHSAQLDDDRVGGRERAEATRIGAQGGGYDLGVAAVVLSAGHETVAEAVHLLRRWRGP